MLMMNKNAMITQIPKRAFDFYLLIYMKPLVLKHRANRAVTHANDMIKVVERVTKE